MPADQLTLSHPATEAFATVRLILPLVSASSVGGRFSVRHRSAGLAAAQLTSGLEHIPMGLFSRKPSSSASTTASGTNWIGRKFRSNLPIEACLVNFSLAYGQCYETVGDIRDVPWSTPEGAASFSSSQGSSTTLAPARSLAVDLRTGGAIYLALWEGMVSYGDGSGQGGPPCEMWFVPPGFDTSPIPIAGRWKMVDGSLSSIGWVDRELWGA